MLAGQRVSIIQNSITSGSDGIVIGAGVAATAAIDIGLSVDNRNVFRGAIAAPAEQYLRNLSVANINAIYNDWNAYNDAAIEGVICHDGDAGLRARRRRLRSVHRLRPRRCPPSRRRPR